MLERFADYWNPDVPYLDRVEWTIGVDPELSLLRIQDGEQDMMSEPIPSARSRRSRTTPDLTAQLFEGPFNNVNYITLSLDHEAMADLRVRQAIAHAVDKERFVRAIKGLGEVATGGLFSPLSPYFQDGLAYPYDPEQAKALLAEAGYADGFEVTFWSGDFTPYKEMAETVTQDLEAIGITMDTKILIREQWLAEIVKNPPGITNNEWELPYPHGSYVMDGAFTQAAIDGRLLQLLELREPRLRRARGAGPRLDRHERADRALQADGQDRHPGRGALGAAHLSEDRVPRLGAGAGLRASPQHRRRPRTSSIATGCRRAR